VSYDELFGEALRIVQETGQASVSLIQRRLRIGYTRSARIIDQLEQAGHIGPYRGEQPREVFVKPAEDKLASDPVQANDEIDKLLKGIGTPEGYGTFICPEHGPVLVKDDEPGPHYCNECTKLIVPKDSEKGLQAMSRFQRRQARKQNARMQRRFLKG